MKKLLSTRQASEYLKLTDTRVRQLCRNGLGFKVGNYYVIPEDDLRMFAEIPRPVGRPKIPKKISENPKNFG